MSVFLSDAISCGRDMDASFRRRDDQALNTGIASTGFRASFADEVDLAIPPLGGDAVPLSRIVAGDDYARGVIALLSGFAATQHVSSNHFVTVDGDEASCVCYTHATHYLPYKDSHPWLTIGARYDIAARRIEGQGRRIVRFRWKEQWAEGNSGVWEIATARLKARAG